VRPVRLAADCVVVVAGDDCPLPPAALLESVVRQSLDSAVADVVLGVAPPPRLAAVVLGLPIALTRVLLGLTSVGARPVPAAMVQVLLRVLTIAVGNVAGFRLHHLGACHAPALALPCTVLDPRLLMLCDADTALGAIGRRPLAVAADVVVADERSRGVVASRAAFAASPLALCQARAGGDDEEAGRSLGRRRCCWWSWWPWRRPPGVQPPSSTASGVRARMRRHRACPVAATTTVATHPLSHPRSLCSRCAAPAKRPPSPTAPCRDWRHIAQPCLACRHRWCDPPAPTRSPRLPTAC